MSLTYFGEDDNFIKGECSECGRVLKIRREYAKETSHGYDLNPPGIKCFCGTTYLRITSKLEVKATLKCPKCGCTQIAAGNKGFGLGKAAAGGFLLGPVGLLGGLVGSKKVMITCLSCGHKWHAGKA
ncbi:hypothetical protein CEB3_c33860 [Peptococcaceae bacterium CEB3]|nr:hypothetical protein CEB3_c33860 [Peptococcaceae bacterium CEB3]